jgi:hypothetical protein
VCIPVFPMEREQRFHINHSFCRRFYPLHPPHVGAQDFGDSDRSVRILVILQYRNQGASYGQSGAIQGMYQFVFTLGIFITGLQTACLKGFAVGNRTDFPEGILAWHPHFQKPMSPVHKPITR